MPNIFKRVPLASHQLHTYSDESMCFALQGKDDAQRSKTEERKPGNDKKRDGINSSVKLSAAAKDTGSDSSDLESSEEDGDTKNDTSDSEVPALLTT